MSEVASGDPSTKSSWRDWAKHHREGVDWEAISGGVRKSLLAWPRLQSASHVLLYLPMANEVNIRPLVDSDLECRWLTTRTPRSGRALTIHELSGPLEVHPYGYLQPHQSAPEVRPDEIDCFLVPGLTFDLWGNRLGWGAGYYDTLLAEARQGVPFVGVVPADLVVDQLPAEAHDVAMTHLATEEGVIETARHEEVER